jgi:RimJ/RimL family protein N-acetyltransferase
MPSSSPSNLNTERLRLRRFTPADVDHLYALDNDPDVMRYINGGTPTPRHVIERELLPGFLHFDAQTSCFGFWAAETRAASEFVGWFLLRNAADDPTTAYLGYRLHRAYWGRGYATEGASALVGCGFDACSLQQVIATTYEENGASRRVMEKLGMRYVRAFRLTPEELTRSDTHHAESVEVWNGDDVEYCITRDEWFALHRQ